MGLQGLGVRPRRSQHGSHFPSAPLSAASTSVQAPRDSSPPTIDHMPLQYVSFRSIYRPVRRHEWGFPRRTWGAPKLCKEGWPRKEEAGRRRLPRPEPSVPRALGLVPPCLLVTELPPTRENPGKAEQGLPLPPPCQHSAPRPHPPPKQPRRQEKTVGLQVRVTKCRASPFWAKRRPEPHTPLPGVKHSEMEQRPVSGRQAARGPSQAWCREAAPSPARDTTRSEVWGWGGHGAFPSCPLGASCGASLLSAESGLRGAGALVPGDEGQ